MKTQKHFTLIELLVVIAIIAILAAMLLPALSSARASGQTAACSGNLKNVGLFVNMYADISNDYMPPVYDKGNRMGEWIWQRLDNMGLGLDKNNYKYNGCPVPRPLIEEKKLDTSSTGYNLYGGYALYGYNSYFGYIASYANGVPTPGTSWSQKYGFTTRGAMKNIENKVAAADSHRQVNLAYMRYYTDYTKDHIGWIHGNATANVLFVPGHVENHSYKDFELSSEGKHDTTTNKWMKPDKDF